LKALYLRKYGAFSFLNPHNPWIPKIQGIYPINPCQLARDNLVTLGNFKFLNRAVSVALKL